MSRIRCEWGEDNPLYVDYHDHDWGVPVHDDRKLFEMLVLEGAQAGLSWLTILKKREGYRTAFAGFDPVVVAGYDEMKTERLLQNPEIVRNRLKIHSAIKNAQVVLKIQDEYGSLDTFLWKYVDGNQTQNSWITMSDIPAETDVSRMMSKDLKNLGCSFVGPTICYAFMQSVGMVNDHLTKCFRYRELKK